MITTEPRDVPTHSIPHKVDLKPNTAVMRVLDRSVTKTASGVRTQMDTVPMRVCLLPVDPAGPPHPNAVGKPAERPTPPAALCQRYSTYTHSIVVVVYFR